MKRDDESAREKIILAAIDILEARGLNALTTRNIARAAGVNSAAINYYFGSKDNLMDIIFRQTLTEGFVNMIDESFGIYPHDPYKGLHALLTQQIEGMHAFPGISRAHLQSFFRQDASGGIFLEYFNPFIESILKHVTPLFPDKKPQVIKIQIVMLLSALYFPTFFPSLFKDFAKLDFNDPKVRKRYVNTLMKTFVPRE